VGGLVGRWQKRKKRKCTWVTSRAQMRGISNQKRGGKTGKTGEGDDGKKERQAGARKPKLKRGNHADAEGE
jgi:hypothetical protein